MLAFEGTSWVLREAWPAVEIFWELIVSASRPSSPKLARLDDQGADTSRPLQGASSPFSLVELWRNFPCVESYRRLPPCYRPTEMQLCIPHSPFIDWLPWPDLREQLISLQPSNQIDSDVIVRTAIQNAVLQRYGQHCKTPSNSNIPADRSGSLNDQGAPVAEGTSFRLWELCQLEKQCREASTKNRSNQSYKQISPGIASLCKVYGLCLTDIPGTQLDPAFFRIYPFLRSDLVRSRFRIQRLGGISPLRDIGLPLEIAGPTLERLEKRMDAVNRRWIHADRYQPN